MQANSHILKPVFIGIALRLVWSAGFFPLNIATCIPPDHLNLQSTSVASVIVIAAALLVVFLVLGALLFFWCHAPPQYPSTRQSRYCTQCCTTKPVLDTFSPVLVFGYPSVCIVPPSLHQ